MSDRQYCVYIMTNTHHTVLYTGVTNDLQRRVLEHRDGKTAFTKKYNVTKLVFLECGDDINIAIAREKQIKGGSRKKKLDLINSVNPEWKDLFEEHFGNSVTAGEDSVIASRRSCYSAAKQSPRNGRLLRPKTARSDTRQEEIASRRLAMTLIRNDTGNERVV